MVRETEAAEQFGTWRARSFYASGWRTDLVWRAAVPRLLPDSVLARTAHRALQAAGAPKPGSISIVLTDDAEVEFYNRRHLGREEPTDVLSFPRLPAGSFPDHEGRSPAASTSPHEDPRWWADQRGRITAHATPMDVCL